MGLIGVDWHFHWGVHKRRGEANQQRRAFRGAGRPRHEHASRPGEARHQRHLRRGREPLNGVPTALAAGCARQTDSAGRLRAKLHQDTVHHLRRGAAQRSAGAGAGANQYNVHERAVSSPSTLATNVVLEAFRQRVQERCRRHAPYPL
jgi:hypothetical protein